MIPREVVEAAQEIQRFERKDNPDALKQIDFGEVKGKKIHIDHVELLNSLVKFISFVRMPLPSKEIMISKLTHPGLTNMEIALQRAMRVTDVDLYEEEGKHCVVAALNSTSLQEAISKYNTESSVNSAVRNIKSANLGGNTIE